MRRRMMLNDKALGQWKKPTKRRRETTHNQYCEFHFWFCCCCCFWVGTNVGRCKYDERYPVPITARYYYYCYKYCILYRQKTIMLDGLAFFGRWTKRSWWTSRVTSHEAVYSTWGKVLFIGRTSSNRYVKLQNTKTPKTMALFLLHQESLLLYYH